MTTQLGTAHRQRQPRELHLTWLLYRGLLASLAADIHGLQVARSELLCLDAVGEAALLEGLCADLHGDRKAALRSFARAAARCTCSRPPAAELAMVCAAQLLDALGEGAAAVDLMGEAVEATELRRNEMPFLGWLRHGTPIATLLTRLVAAGATPWLAQVAETTSASPEVVRIFTPVTRGSGEQRTDVPMLSPRERDVLDELARGSTYADIAATLVIAESTVKTHVSSLYAKLGASRRSEALAAARGLRLV